MFRRKEDKGVSCWICGRTTPSEHQSILPEEFPNIFSQVFPEADPYTSLSKYCLCSICISILKYIASDSFKLKKKLEETSERLKKGASTLKKFIGEKTEELKDKAAEIRETKD